MKKIIQLLLCTILIFVSFCPISASANTNTPEELLTNVEISVHERMLNTNETSSRKDVTLTAYSAEEGFNIRVEVIGDMLYIYNDDTDMLITSNVIGSSSNDIDTYGWSGWYKTGEDDIRITAEESLSLTLLTAAVAALITASGGFFTLITAVATYIATKAFDHIYVNAPFSLKYSDKAWAGCEILVWSKVDSYVGTDFIASKESDHHFWVSTPWDYTRPSECRLIENTYPY